MTKQARTFHDEFVKKERDQDIEEIQPSRGDLFEGAAKKETVPTLDRDKNQPSEEQLCELVVLLKKIFPHRDLTRAITMIHQIMVQRLPYSQIFPELRIRGTQIQAEDKFNNDVAEVKQLFSKESLQKTDFPSQYDEERYKERRLMAKAFVGNGYSYQYAVQEFKKAKLLTVNYTSFNREKYKSIMGSIASQAWRRLEVFLKESCKKDITFLNREEIKKIMNPLLSSTYFGQFIPVFKKYFRYLYGLSKVELCEGQSWNFYQLVLRELGGSPSGLENSNANENVSQSLAKDINSSEQLEKEGLEEIRDNSSWTQEEDNQLIGSYEKTRSMMSTAQIFKEKGLPHTALDKINGRMIKLASLALKKIQSETKREEIPFPHLTGTDVSLICRSRTALNLRIELLKYSRTQRCDREQLAKVISLLKSFLEEKDREKVKIPPECEMEVKVSDDFQIFQATEDVQCKNEQIALQNQGYAEDKKEQ